MKTERFGNIRPRLRFGVSDLEQLSDPVSKRWADLRKQVEQDAAQEESAEKLDVGPREG